MFSSRKAVTTIEDVPVQWIFEHYLSLNCKLQGQNIMIKSAFNPKDTNPSMSIFISNVTNNYAFVCHSTGIKGNGTDLVSILLGISKSNACRRIVNDYRQYIQHNTVPHLSKDAIETSSKWKIVSYNTRAWNVTDVNFWSPFNIGSSLLGLYNVKPLSSFVFERGDEQMYMRPKSICYGYFTAEGEIYKLYQPYDKDKKFLNLKQHVQGWDQIEGKSRLFICSSLKDIMSMRSLGIDGDYIAPQSENSGVDHIINWIMEYPEKYVIFDNDQAGLKMMEHYQKTYGIPYVHLEMSKDISDSVRDHGASNVKKKLISIIK